MPQWKRWEAGEETPTPDQVTRMSFYLNFPLKFFYGPDIEWPDESQVHICGMDGRQR